MSVRRSLSFNITPLGEPISGMTDYLSSDETPRSLVIEGINAQNLPGSTDLAVDFEALLPLPSLIPAHLDTPQLPESLSPEQEIKILRQILLERDETILEKDGTIADLKQRIRDFNHETRNRMTVFNAKTDDMLHMSKKIQRSGSGTPDLLEQAEHLRKTSFSLKELSHDLIETSTHFLDMDKMQQGEMSYGHSPIDLKQYFEDTANDHISLAKNTYNKTLTITAEIEANDFWVMSDCTALNRIFPNFLTNAIKFTPDNGSITIIVATIAQNKDVCHLQMTVKDTGMGMDPEKAKMLFPDKNQKSKTTYTQIHDTQKMNVGGSGLGLSLAHKTITDYLQGKVTVVSNPGKGTSIAINSTFIKPSTELILASQQQHQLERQLESITITPVLPTARKPKGPSSRATHSSHAMPLSLTNDQTLQTDSETLHALIAEDDKTNQKLLARQMNSLGYTCSIANNGQEALDIYKQSKEEKGRTPFTVIFMDLQMPILDGIEATKAIRLYENSSKPCPIVGASGNVGEADRNTAKKAGMTAYIAKPYNILEIRKALNNIEPPKFTLTPVTAFKEEALSTARSSVNVAKRSLFKKHNKISPLSLPPATESLQQSTASGTSPNPLISVNSPRLDVESKKSPGHVQLGLFAREETRTANNNLAVPTTTASQALAVSSAAERNKRKPSSGFSLRCCLPKFYRG